MKHFGYNITGVVLNVLNKSYATATDNRSPISESIQQAVTKLKGRLVVLASVHNTSEPVTMLEISTGSKSRCHL